MVKKKQIAEESSSEEEQFHVEVILAAKVNEDGGWWANYDSDSNRERSGCDRLLNSFWHHVGLDDEDYNEGYEVRAEDEWIDKEKLYFAQTFGSGDNIKPEKKRPAKEKNKVPVLESGHKKKQKRTSLQSTSASTSKSQASKREKETVSLPTNIDSSSDEDSTPLLQNRIMRKRSNKQVDPSSESENSVGEKRPRKVQKVSRTATEGGKTAARTPTASNKKDRQSSLFSDSSSSDTALKNMRPVNPRSSTSKTTGVAPQSAPSMPPKQQARRGIKLAPMELKGTGAAIATKARLAQGAGASTSSTARPPQPVFPQRSNLANLSFKKKDTALASTTAAKSVQGMGAGMPPKNVSTSAPLTINTSNPAIRTAGLPGSAQTPVSAQSGHGYTSMAGSSMLDSHGFHPQPPVPPDPRRQAPALPRRSHSQTSPDVDSMAQVDDFLTSIMSSELAAPILYVIHRDSWSSTFSI
ncbi:hypothetical protein B0H21DRAFT_737547 [Amylocystis lapponica]|nr:hypothetical protein B0H21DRAFT_737547 [Amylocystis lapponica]